MHKNNVLFWILGWNVGGVISQFIIDNCTPWVTIIGTIVLAIIGICCKSED